MCFNPKGGCELTVYQGEEELVFHLTRQEVRLLVANLLGQELKPRYPHIQVELTSEVSFHRAIGLVWMALREHPAPLEMMTFFQEHADEQEDDFLNYCKEWVNVIEF